MKNLRALMVTAVVGLNGAAACDRQDSTAAEQQCIASNPRAGDVADQPAVQSAIAECLDDSGACQASTPCMGKVSDRECVDTRLISPAAAICIARHQGLLEGLTGPGAGLAYNYGYRRITWSVSNLLYDRRRGVEPDGGGGDEGGQAMIIDAITGRLHFSGQWSGTRN
jgi:hypothetical protein